MIERKIAQTPDDRFWLVWNTAHGVNSMTYKHPSKASAEREAERLSTHNPGQTFVVLKAVSQVQTEPDILWGGFKTKPDMDDGIPF